jgi:FkbM family methyltransferase
MFRRITGISMRMYRASPFYPRCGKALARMLALVSRPSGSVLTEINGVQFDLDLREVIDASLYYSGTFESDAEKVIASVVRPAMVAVDIGANIGYHTFGLAKLVGPDGLVVAVEPTAYAFEKLQRNLQLNKFANIRPVKVGLADRDKGEVQALFRSSYRLDGRGDVNIETIRVLTLDTLVREQQLERLDFIKMDVDGYEAKVFAGAEGVLQRFRPYLFFEFGPRGIREQGDDPEALLHLLWGLGYRLRTENGRELLDMPSIFRAVQPVDGMANLLAVPPRRF